MLTRARPRRHAKSAPPSRAVLAEPKRLAGRTPGAAQAALPRSLGRSPGPAGSPPTLPPGRRLLELAAVRPLALADRSRRLLAAWPGLAAAQSLGARPRRSAPGPPAWAAAVRRRDRLPRPPAPQPSACLAPRACPRDSRLPAWTPVRPRRPPVQPRGSVAGRTPPASARTRPPPARQGLSRARRRTARAAAMGAGRSASGPSGKGPRLLREGYSDPAKQPPRHAPLSNSNR
jgi:hypothetical protein